MLRDIRDLRFNSRDMRRRDQGAEAFRKKTVPGQHASPTRAVCSLQKLYNGRYSLCWVSKGKDPRQIRPENAAIYAIEFVRRFHYARYAFRIPARSFLPAVLSVIPLAALRCEGERDSDKALAEDRREVEKARKSPPVERSLRISAGVHLKESNCEIWHYLKLHSA